MGAKVYSGYLCFVVENTNGEKQSLMFSIEGTEGEIRAKQAHIAGSYKGKILWSPMIKEADKNNHVEAVREIYGIGTSFKRAQS